MIATVPREEGLDVRDRLQRIVAAAQEHEIIERPLSRERLGEQQRGLDHRENAPVNRHPLSREGCGIAGNFPKRSDVRFAIDVNAKCAMVGRNGLDQLLQVPGIVVRLNCI